MTTALIIAGGTGGHIFPALAVADLLNSHGVHVHWLGSKIGLEKNLVPRKFPLIVISAQRLRGKGINACLAAPFNLMRSVWQAYRAIRRLRPQVVLAMGGFVSGPGGIAAKLAGVPLVVHEQNAIAGYSNRILVQFADVVISAYPNVFPTTKKAQVVGNPVRTAISAIPSPSQRLAQRSGKLCILVLGGSQGAHGLNQIVGKLASEFPQHELLEFWHQTGPKDYPEIQALYDRLPVVAKVEAFIDDVAVAYQWADLVICRAGALTVAEITAVGIASILVPFPAAVDDHQWHNAKHLEQAGAAQLIREADVSPERIIALIDSLVQNRSRLLAMAEKARALAKPEAAATVAALVEAAASRGEK